MTDVCVRTRSRVEHATRVLHPEAAARHRDFDMSPARAGTVPLAFAAPSANPPRENMETLGSLLDKLSIENIRLSKLAERGDAELLEPVRLKLENLKSEINGHLSLAIAGEIPIEEPKLKFYKGEHPAGDVFTAISDAISRLFEANITLWNLEDRRRDRSLPDAERLAICDDVATWNRVRNDAMDAVNRMLKDMITGKARP